MTNVHKTFLNNRKNFLLLILKVMMEKIERQESLINKLTTRGTEAESYDVLKGEDSKCS